MNDPVDWGKICKLNEIIEALENSDNNVDACTLMHLTELYERHTCISMELHQLIAKELDAKIEYYEANFDIVETTQTKTTKKKLFVTKKYT